MNLTAGRLLRILVVVAALILFVWVSAEMEAGRMASFDRLVRVDVHADTSRPLTFALEAATWLGSTWSLVVGTVVGFALFWRRGWRLDAARLAAAMIGSSLWLNVLKFVFHRPRPPVPYFGQHLPSWSYPSGHALTSLCFFGVLAAILTGRAAGWPARVALWAAAVILVAAIGFSRVYLGDHYPSDVLGGYLLGLAWTVGVWEAVRPRRGRRTEEPNTP